MRTFDVLVFDLGGVLVDWNPEYLYKDIFPNEDERRWFLSTICTLDWNEEQDAGRSLPARDLGFYGIHFRSPKEFREELVGLGVLE